MGRSCQPEQALHPGFCTNQPSEECLCVPLSLLWSIYKIDGMVLILTLKGVRHLISPRWLEEM